MKKHVCLTILLVVFLSNLLSACANNTRNHKEGHNNTKTAQLEPTSNLSLDECEEEGNRTDYFKALDSILDGFALGSYKCVFVGERVVVWVVKTEAPEKYDVEGVLIDAAIPKIETYLNTLLSNYYDGTKKVYFFYGGTSVAFTPGGSYTTPVIFMPLSSDPYSFHNYVHELTHLLTPQHSDWVSEGLAVYLNDKWGGEGGFPNYRADIDQLALSYLDRTDILKNVGDDTYYPSRSDLMTSVGQGWYILSGSFVKIMIEKIGIESFMQIYHAPDMQAGLEKMTKKTLQEWKTAWLSYLLSMKN
jgi:hypothetical protein